MRSQSREHRNTGFLYEPANDQRVGNRVIVFDAHLVWPRVELTEAVWRENSFKQFLKYLNSYFVINSQKLLDVKRF